MTDFTDEKAGKRVVANKCALDAAQEVTQSKRGASINRALRSNGKDAVKG
jgi:hypothetical protein